MDKPVRELTFIESPILLEIPDGKSFLKEVIYEGEFMHPQDSKVKMKISVDRMKNWISNFKQGIPDIVYVPLNHSNRPEDNTGSVEDIFLGPSKAKPGKMALWAKMKIALGDIAEKIGKTILGCSIGIEKYSDPESGKDRGEIVGHIALTNEPYIQHLAPFQVAFSKDENAKITNFVLTEEPADGEIKASTEELEKAKRRIKMEKELEALKEKLAKMEAERKESDKALEAERKERADLQEKMAKDAQASFEREMGSEVDKLVSAGSVKPADKAEVLEQVISLGRDKASGMLKILAKNKVIDTSVKATTTLSRPSESEAVVKLSEAQALFGRAVMFPKEIESIKSEWSAMCERAKGGIKQDIPLYARDGKTVIDAER